MTWVVVLLDHWLYVWLFLSVLSENRNSDYILAGADFHLLWVGLYSYIWRIGGETTLFFWGVIDWLKKVLWVRIRFLVYGIPFLVFVSGWSYFDALYHPIRGIFLQISISGAYFIISLSHGNIFVLCWDPTSEWLMVVLHLTANLFGQLEKPLITLKSLVNRIAASCHWNLLLIIGLNY